MRLAIALVCAGAACARCGTGRRQRRERRRGRRDGGHPIEFVAKGQEIAFYILEDDGKSPTPTNGFSGRAVIQDAGKTIAVALSPAEPNKFVGQLAMPLGAKARVVFSAKVPGHTLQARFTTE